MCCALPTCAQSLAWPTHARERQVQWVSFLGDGRSSVGLGLLVSSACRSGLHNREKVKRRGAGLARKITLTKKRNTETWAHKNANQKKKRKRARKNKYKHKYKHKYIIQIQIQIQEARARKYKYKEKYRDARARTRCTPPSTDSSFPWTSRLTV